MRRPGDELCSGLGVSGALRENVDYTGDERTVVGGGENSATTGRM